MLLVLVSTCEILFCAFPAIPPVIAPIGLLAGVAHVKVVPFGNILVGIAAVRFELKLAPLQMVAV